MRSSYSTLNLAYSLCRGFLAFFPPLSLADEILKGRLAGSVVMMVVISGVQGGEMRVTVGRSLLWFGKILGKQSFPPPPDSGERITSRSLRTLVHHRLQSQVDCIGGWRTGVDPWGWRGSRAGSDTEVHAKFLPRSRLGVRGDGEHGDHGITRETNLHERIHNQLWRDIWRRQCVQR